MKKILPDKNLFVIFFQEVILSYTSFYKGSNDVNYKLLILTTSLVLFAFCHQSLAMNISETKTIYTQSSKASDHEYEEILKIIDCFKIYTNYFNDIYYLDGYVISNHGENLDDGLIYLREGFSEELAFKILDYCTYWHEGIKKQVIITGEGIPVFTLDDIDECSFYIEENTITLKINYYDCYTLGDHYIYYITAFKVDDQYIINDLKWQANILLAKL